MYAAVSRAAWLYDDPPFMLRASFHYYGILSSPINLLFFLVKSRLTSIFRGKVSYLRYRTGRICAPQLPPVPQFNIADFLNAELIKFFDCFRIPNFKFDLHFISCLRAESS